jgi:hypothetical protein
MQESYPADSGRNSDLDKTIRNVTRTLKMFGSKANVTLKGNNVVVHLTGEDAKDPDLKAELKDSKLKSAKVGISIKCESYDPIVEYMDDEDDVPEKFIKSIIDKNGTKLKFMRRGNKMTDPIVVYVNGTHEKGPYRSMAIAKAKIAAMSPKELLSEENQSLEERKVLSVLQRRHAAIAMKKNKMRIKTGAKRQARMAASSDRLLNRGKRDLRAKLFKKFASGKSKAQVSLGQRVSIDARLQRMAKRIEKLAARMVPKLRKIDQQRRNNRMRTGSANAKAANLKHERSGK